MLPGSSLRIRKEIGAPGFESEDTEGDRSEQTSRRHDDDFNEPLHVSNFRNEPVDLVDLVPWHQRHDRATSGAVTPLNLSSTDFEIVPARTSV